MKVVFIGCGYLGYNLSEQLKNDFDVTILGIDSPYSFSSSCFKRCDVFDLAQLVNQDLEDAIVVDTVSLVSNRTVTDDEEKFLRDLGDKYQGLLDVLKATHVKRYIYFSSGGTIYGESLEPVKETHVLAPKSLYGKSKQYLENLIINSGINYLILRPSNPYGGTQITNGQGVIPILIDCALNGKTFETYVDLKSERDYFYIDDFVQGLKQLILNDVNCEIINIGSGVATTLEDVILGVEKATQKKIDIKIGTVDSSAVHSIVLDINKLNETTGYKPVVSLDEGIQKEVLRIKGE